MFDNNILRFAGYGWGGLQRPNKGVQGFLVGWKYTYQDGEVENFVISNNIFDCANCYFLYSNPIFSLYNNTYYQKRALRYNINSVIVRDGDSYAVNQETFEAAIKMFDEKPKAVKWLEYDSECKSSTYIQAKNRNCSIAGEKFKKIWIDSGENIPDLASDSLVTAWIKASYDTSKVNITSKEFTDARNNLEQMINRGDCNCDSYVNIVDIVALKLYLAGKSDIDLLSSDIDMDGYIISCDLTCLIDTLLKADI